MNSKNSFAFKFSSSTMQNFSLLPLHSEKKTSTKNSKTAKLWTREHSGESGLMETFSLFFQSSDSPLCSLVQSLADLLFLVLVFFFLRM